MRSSALVLAASVLTACFSPEVDPNANAEGSGSEGSSGGVGSSGAGLEPSTTGNDTETSGDPDTTAGDSETGTTDPNDAPPVVEAFTVNGSTRPAEVDEGGTITLEADATDDMGVNDVEFFDGDTSLGVVDSAPFELEVPVSSADSGSHTYRAVATDTAGQTGESEEVVLSVNIVGGVIEILREDLFTGVDVLAVINGGLDTEMEDRVFLSAIVDDGGTSQIMAFNDGLSQLWSRTIPGQTPGSPTTQDDQLVVGSTDAESLTLVYYVLSPTTGDTVTSLVLETDAGSGLDIAGSGRVSKSEGRVIINNSLQHIAAYEASLSEQAWLANQPTTTDLVGSGQHLFVSFGSSGVKCATGSDFCVRRYGSDGQIDWTAGLPVTHPSLLAPHPDGGAFAVVGFSDEGYDVFRIQTDGATSLIASLGKDDAQYVSAADADGAGGLVLAGASGGYGTGRAFVTRLRPDGTLGWDQRPFFNGGVDSAALDVQVEGAQVYVYGITNNNTDFLSFTGDGWIARLSL